LFGFSMEIGLLDLKQEEVVQCSTYTTGSTLFICLQTERKLEFYGLFIGQRQPEDSIVLTSKLRIAIDDNIILTGIALSPGPPKMPCQIAILTRAGSVTLLNVSTHISGDKEVNLRKGKIVSLKRLLSSTDTATELWNYESDQCSAVSLASVSRVDDLDMHLLVVGCNDGSIIEICWGTSDEGSIVKRRNFQACSSLCILKLDAMESKNLDDCNIIACALWDMKTRQESVGLCCARKNISPQLSALDEDYADGVWKENDPDVSWDSGTAANPSTALSSFFLNSEAKQLMVLALPHHVVALRQNELESSNVPLARVDAPKLELINMSILPSTSPFVEIALGFAHNNLRCVKTLTQSDLEVGSSISAEPQRQWVVALCADLRAMYFFELPIDRLEQGWRSNSLSTVSMTVHPALQIDLLPLLYQQCCGDLTLLEPSETVICGAIKTNSGIIILGTTFSRLLVCAADLTVLQNLSLQGRILSVSEAAIFTTSAVYVCTHAKDPILNFSNILGSVSEETGFTNELDSLSMLELLLGPGNTPPTSPNLVIEAFEVAALERRFETAACAQCLYWVGRVWPWQQKYEGWNFGQNGINDPCFKEHLLDLAVRCLLRLARQSSQRLSSSDYSSFISSRVSLSNGPSASALAWQLEVDQLLLRPELAGGSSAAKADVETKSDPTCGSAAMALLKQVLIFAVNQLPSAVPLLFEVCADSRHLPSLAILLYCCNELDASALAHLALIEKSTNEVSAHRTDANQSSNDFAQDLFNEADLHIARLCLMRRTQVSFTASFIEKCAVRIVLGMLDSLRRGGVASPEVEVLVLNRWGGQREEKNTLAMRSLGYILFETDSEKCFLDFRQAREYCSAFGGEIVLQLLVAS